MNKVIATLVGITIVFFLILVMMFQDTYVRSLRLDSKGKSAIDLDNYCKDSIIGTVESFFLSRVALVNKDIDTIHITIPPKGMYLLEKNRTDAVNNRFFLVQLVLMGILSSTIKELKQKLGLKESFLIIGAK